MLIVTCCDCKRFMVCSKNIDEWDRAKEKYADDMRRLGYMHRIFQACTEKVV